MHEYRFHPLAERYPLMETAELERLADDIGRRGLMVPIVLWHGEIIDGRNRYLACRMRGVEPFFLRDDHVDEADLEAHVAGFNEHRRHLSKGDLARRRRERIARVKGGRSEGKSLRTLAAEEGVSAEQVRRDLKAAPVNGVTPGAVAVPDADPAAPGRDRGVITGRDGKTYPARARPKPDAPPPGARSDAPPPDTADTHLEMLSLLAKVENLLGDLFRPRGLPAKCRRALETLRETRQ